ncbi:acyl-CoA dehydrogenase family protein [Acetobacter persici]|uniref:SfnB family sulfur acquisition oxidoreductase n=1 Tax=Acetobacter persici TaxID=1076596 RepID=A0A6V8I9L0_9PROT|nr:acyl-CoA dehydrogenase family protein [Acetobacter persici]OUI89828.1 dehydrogenase [Acetobacter persici]GFE94299.1 SfnB family sulfur acquisition oxidoreductase [Acetobacter persici]
MTDYVHLARTLAPVIAEEASRRDAERILPFDIFEKIARSGLGAARVQKELGGGDVTQGAVAEIFIVLGKADPNVAQALFPHFINIEQLRLMAGPDAQARYLGQIGRGRISSGAVAERTGSFRGEIHTHLAHVDGKTVLRGRKFYSTGCLFADLIKVQALDEAGKPLYVMLPKDAQGLVLKDDWDGMGQRTTASGTTEFHDIALSAEQIIPIGHWSGRRNYVGASAQLIHCAIDVGIGLAVLDDAIYWARNHTRPLRESGVSKATDDPYILYAVGEIAARVRAAEALVRRAAGYVEQAARAQLEDVSRGHATTEETENLLVQSSIAVAEAKIASTESALYVSQKLYDVGGAATTQKPFNFDRHWRNARTHTTHDSVAYKYKAIGNFLLNEEPPPITFTY